ncbi:MAG: glycosyltransferase [Halofilum sp. (in: g-proteobacteria)]|nr:glycosyltransferase [Halofilum sp. (in: g-proteobacteria)]
MNSMHERHIAVLVSYSGDGGVERMMNVLVAGFLDAGWTVDLLVLQRRGGHFSRIPSGARIIEMHPQHASLATGSLERYLRKERPTILLAAKDRAGRAALRACIRAGDKTRVILCIANTLSKSLARHGRLWRALRYVPIRRWYPRADAVVATSEGVAADIIKISGIMPNRVHVIPIPVISEDFVRLAQEKANHRWFDESGIPVIIGVGRLTPQKDFFTLIRAFSILRRSIDARLLILGEGSERSELLRLANELGVVDSIDLPGFVSNPHAWMRQADIFVLSSVWEGFGIVLVEAMGVGTPVVSTDCPHGPREILEDGRWGPLVGVGGADALARAIRKTLENPLPPDTLRTAANKYSQKRITDRYLDLFDELLNQ